MAKTQNINDFQINIGRSSRRKVDKSILGTAQNLIDEANITGSVFQFQQNEAPIGKAVSGASVGRRTTISVVSDKNMIKLGYEAFNGRGAFHTTLDPKKKIKTLRLLRRQGIKLKNKEDISSFIFMSEGYFKREAANSTGRVEQIAKAAKVTFHEIGHAISTLAGTKSKDYKAIDHLYELSTQDSNLSYESISQAATGALKAHAFEEARAETVSYTLASKTGLRNYLRTNLQLGGYAPSDGFSNYYSRYEPRIEHLMDEVSSRNISITGIPQNLVAQETARNIKQTRQFAKIEAHATFNSSLSIPDEFSQVMGIRQRELADETIGRLHEKSPHLIPKYRESMLETSGNTTGLLITPYDSSSTVTASSKSFNGTDNYLRSFNNIDRTSEFLAQSDLVKPSLLPEMAEEALSTSGAVISSSRSTAPELIETTLEAGTAKLSRGGLKMFGSAAKKTSTKIIERYGNCF
ncbi:hypothetical protein [Flavobacterium sp.]|uniref:hypothetical protein n=1 Tax=Flavobacterium sp. TaxID=239 RepID=UPI003BBB4F67